MNPSDRRGLLYFTLCFGLVIAGCYRQQGDASIPGIFDSPAG